MNCLNWTNNYSISKNSDLRWKYVKIIDSRTQKIIACNIIEYVSPINNLVSLDGVYYFRIGISLNISTKLCNKPEIIIPLSLKSIQQYTISDTENVDNSDFFILTDIDRELIPLLMKMNNIRGISTFWSCSGHSFRPSIIVFKDTFDYMKRNYQKWIDSFDLLTITGTDPYYSLVDIYQPGYQINPNCIVIERIDKNTTHLIKPSLLDIRSSKMLCTHNKGAEAYKDIKLLANSL